MAKAMGEQEDYKTFLERSQNYINVFDPTTKFMRGRFMLKVLTMEED